MYHIYFDAEFDAVRVHNKFQQAVISIGAVLMNEYMELIDEFYMLVCPKRFRRLSPVVKRMTHLTNEDIKQAASFSMMVEQLHAWIKTYTKDEDFGTYSFGPDDRRTLVQNYKDNTLDDHGIFSNMKDVQKQVSAHIFYQNKLVSPTLSLDDVKYVYDIEGAVDHNALMDAKDLMEIHRAYLQGKPQNLQHIEDIVKRKEQKQIEVRKRQQEKLKRKMYEQFHSYDQIVCPITFYSEVMEQFHVWEERDQTFQLKVRKQYITDLEYKYKLENTNVSMQIRLDSEMPSVQITLKDPEQCIKKTYLLTYRNAFSIEIILKRLLG